MKFFDLKKYFFVNVSAILGYLPIFIELNYNLHTHKPIHSDDIISDAFAEGLLLGVIFSLITSIMFLTILEILIRKFVIEKFFPNLKFNLHINVPKFITIIYNIIFSIGFIFSSLIFIYCIIVIALP